jgi:hypothetical protein
VSLVDRLLRRRSHFRRCFIETGPSGAAVLADLRRFSGATETPLVVSQARQQVDPLATAVKIGRQEMFWRIAHHLHLDDAQLLKLKDTAEEE